MVWRLFSRSKGQPQCTPIPRPCKPQATKPNRGTKTGSNHHSRCNNTRVHHSRCNNTHTGPPQPGTTVHPRYTAGTTVHPTVHSRDHSVITHGETPSRDHSVITHGETPSRHTDHVHGHPPPHDVSHPTPLPGYPPPSTTPCTHHRAPPTTGYTPDGVVSLSKSSKTVPNGGFKNSCQRISGYHKPGTTDCQPTNPVPLTVRTPNPDTVVVWCH